MRWLSALGTLVLATALNGLPAYPDHNAEVLPKVIGDSNPSTELLPPLNKTASGGKKHQKVYLINVYSVTLPNSDETFEKPDSVESGEGDEGDESDEVSDETLITDLVEKMPAMLEPDASVLLLVEEGAEDTPVDMDYIAKYLEEKGYTIEKIAKDGETRVILLDLLPDEEDQDDHNDDSDDIDDSAVHAKEDHVVDLVKPIETNMIKVRRKRAPCLKCYVDNVLPSYRGNGYGQYGYPDYGRGGYQGGSVPVVVVPVESGRRQYQGQYPSGGGRGYRPSGDYYRPCNGCQGQRGGGWSTSSSQASSQSASGHW